VWNIHAAHIVVATGQYAVHAAGGQDHTCAKMEVCRVGKSIIQTVLQGHQMTAGGPQLSSSSSHLDFGPKSIDVIHELMAIYSVAGMK